MSKNILLFADRLPPLAGGMEVHAGYFIEHFTDHPRFPISGIITKNETMQDCIVLKDSKNTVNIAELPHLFNPNFIFFNSGRWIEELRQIAQIFPKAIFIYRTGGNEILKASLSGSQIPLHLHRQAFWVKTLNSCIAVMITNSAYTETRLREIGISCPFVRCVGGVNTVVLQASVSACQEPLTIFCAARFVPYKNHAMLLSVIQRLILRGYKFRVRLAGDGPLLAEIQAQVQSLGLNDVVEFLGLLDNQAVCREIANANIYMQLSVDYVTEVSGGSYVHSEGMGRAILEALTAGTFVIVGRSGALPEIITGKRGLVLEFDSIDNVTSKIEQVLKNPPTKLSFMNEFSWDTIFKRYEALLEERS